MANIAFVHGKQPVLNPHNLKIGDAVTGYEKGYWIITSINRRFLSEQLLRYDVYNGSSVGDEYSPIVELVKLNEKTGLVTKKTSDCDIAYCVPAKDVIKKQIEELQHFLSLLP